MVAAAGWWGQPDRTGSLRYSKQAAASRLFCRAPPYARTAPSIDTDLPPFTPTALGVGPRNSLNFSKVANGLQCRRGQTSRDNAGRRFSGRRCYCPDSFLDGAASGAQGRRRPKGRPNFHCQPHHYTGQLIHHVNAVGLDAKQHAFAQLAIASALPGPPRASPMHADAKISEPVARPGSRTAARRGRWPIPSTPCRIGHDA